MEVDSGVFLKTSCAATATTCFDIWFSCPMGQQTGREVVYGRGEGDKRRGRREDNVTESDGEGG